MIDITSGKQKSKSIFTGIQQRKLTFPSKLNYNQHFLSGPLYQETNEAEVQGVEGKDSFSQEQHQPEVRTYQVQSPQ